MQIEFKIRILSADISNLVFRPPSASPNFTYITFDRPVIPHIFTALYQDLNPSTLFSTTRSSPGVVHGESHRSEGTAPDSHRLIRRPCFTLRMPPTMVSYSEPSQNL